MELILLAAIAYAAARGVDSIITDTKARYGSKVADAVVKKAAKDKGAGNGKAGPADPGGTFSAREAAPRTASIGAKAAAGVATGIETGATAWKSYLEGYREALPTAREDARRRQLERAKRRQVAREERQVRRQAEREARDAQREADAEAKAAEEAGKADAAADAAAVPPPAEAPAPTVTEAQPEPTEEPAAAGASDVDVEPAPAAGQAKPTLVLLKPSTAPIPTPTGDTVIPEVRTLDGLLNAFGIVKGVCLMRAEEAEAIAADDIELAGRLDALEAQLADLEVDPATRAEITSLSEKIAAQSLAATEYGTAAQNAADLSSAAANAAHMAHGGIAEAVQSAPIEAAAQAGYYNR
jgi:hypothetical protein